MAKLNWKDIQFLAEEVVRIYAENGPDQGNGALTLALEYCTRIKPGFNTEKFIDQIREIQKSRGIVRSKGMS